MSAEFLQASVLKCPSLRHAFFTRRGGVSLGVYASLNGGTGSRDISEAVQANRRLMAQALEVAPERFMVPYLMHSPDAVTIAAPWDEQARPRCDGIATATKGLALGVTGADCGMILFADAQAGVIGAAHAGWKGALYGVLEATLAAMQQLGGRKETCVAALGPMIGAKSYEVDSAFRQRFLEVAADYQRYFTPSVKQGHFMLDLPGFIEMRLRAAGIGGFENLGIDTYANPDRCYSYRRMTHLGEADYGRHVSAIVLV